MRLKLINIYNEILLEDIHNSQVGFECESTYHEGDHFVLECDTPSYVWVRLDEALGEALLYINSTLRFDIPFDERRRGYADNAFAGSHHFASARLAFPKEINSYRNLSLNPYDYNEAVDVFPHVLANAETPGNSAFLAKNVIDGITATKGHFRYPYTSWGIAGRNDAKLELLFGRMVKVDRVVIYERADFPHDNWWNEITLSFSNGDSMICKMTKTDKGQEIVFPEKEISSLTIENLKMSPEQSPFPSLSQLSVYGQDIISR